VLFDSCTQERAAKFDEKGRPPLKRGLSAKSHSLFEAEDKAAEEMILTARKHLFMANNLYSVSNHLREIIEKGEDSATAKVTKKKVILFQFQFFFRKCGVAIGQEPPNYFHILYLIHLMLA